MAAQSLRLPTAASAIVQLASKLRGLHRYPRNHLEGVHPWPQDPEVPARPREGGQERVRCGLDLLPFRAGLRPFDFSFDTIYTKSNCNR